MFGLYVGPSMKSPGCIRVAVLTNGKVQIYVTSRFSAATDGGGFSVHKHVASGTEKLIQSAVVDGDVVNEAPGVVVAEGSDNVSVPTVDSSSSDSTSSDGVDVGGTSNSNDVSATSSSSNRDSSSESVAEPNSSTKKSKKTHKKKQKKAVTFDVDSRPVVVDANPYSKSYTSTSSSRGARMLDRLDYCRSELANVAELCCDVESACLADWSTFTNTSMFWSWGHMSFVEVRGFNPDVYDCPGYELEEGYRAVRENVPRSYEEALAHPRWGEPARKEWNTIVGADALVEIDKEVALDCIKNHKSDLVILFPVYEVKVKDGVTVYKVRLVGDGRTQYHAGKGSTYAATPSREEFLVLLHICAALGWDYAHVDEIRAFLNAKYTGKNRVFTKFRGEDKYYEIKGALYGLKTSPKDYQDVVVERLLKLGYKRLSMCSCMYLLIRGDKVVIIYDFVDDFVFAGNCREFTGAMIAELRGETSFTDPVWNSDSVLGMELERNFALNTISIKMSKRIEEMYKKFNVQYNRKIEVPMPTSGYIIKDDQFEAISADKSKLLTRSEIAVYMSIVGSLIWVAGVRQDILYTVMYLSWSTKAPRAHHLEMARYCIAYLYQSRELPLVLGGSSELQITAYTDASLGTAAKGRSVVGHLVKLNDTAGAIYAKSTATAGVLLSSFEAELDGMTNVLKSVSRVSNILTELQQKFGEVAHVFSDNKAMIEFIRGEGVAKGVRHMELRMWYVREKYKHGGVVVDYMAGVEIPADKLTKLGNKASHAKFRYNILGLGLLPEYATVPGGSGVEVEDEDEDVVEGD